MKKTIDNNSNVAKDGFDLFAFDQKAKQDQYSRASLVLKIRESNFFMTLPDWIRDYKVPYGTMACTLSPVKCMSKLVLMQKETAFNVHPYYQVELVSSFNDLAINHLGVTYVDEKKNDVSLGINNSYLVSDMDDSARVINASTADIVATDAKFDKSENIVVPEWPAEFCVNVSDSTLVRQTTNSVVKNRAKARDEIFEFLSDPANEFKNVHLHSHVGFHLPNFVEVEEMTLAMGEYYDAHKIKRPDNLVTKICGIDDGDVPFTEDIQVAYKMYFKSISIRGGREGKNVSHGYERFSMSRTMSNVLNLVQDFQNMAELYSTKFVLIKDSSYLTTEQIRVLVFNGFRIIKRETTYEVCDVNSSPGVYSDFKGDVNVFEYKVLSDDCVKPTYANDVIRMGVYYEQALALVLKSNKCFAHIYLDRHLSQVNSACLLPSATADTMQCIIATGVIKTYKLELLIRRATMATSCRNRFVHSRKSFSTMDVMGDFVKWESIIQYPKLRVREEKKILDLNFPVGLKKPKVIPLNVNVKALRNRIVQVDSTENRNADLLFCAVDSDPNYFFSVFYAVVNGKSRFTYTDDGGAKWNSKFDVILDMSEAEMLSLLESRGYSKQMEMYHEVESDVVADDTDNNEKEKIQREVETIPMDVKKSEKLVLPRFNIGNATKRKKEKKKEEDSDG